MEGANLLFQYKFSGSAVGAVTFPKTEDLITYNPSQRVQSITVQRTGASPSSLLSLNYPSYGPFGAAERIEGGQNNNTFTMINRHDPTGELRESMRQASDPATLPPEWLGRFTYDYDGNGNRSLTTYQGTLNQQIQYQVDNLSSQYQKVGLDDVQYDRNGNLIKKGQIISYRYDFLGRLKQVRSLRPALPQPRPVPGLGGAGGGSGAGGGP